MKRLTLIFTLALLASSSNVIAVGALPRDNVSCPDANKTVYRTERRMQEYYVEVLAVVKCNGSPLIFSPSHLRNKVYALESSNVSAGNIFIHSHPDLLHGWQYTFSPLDMSNLDLHKARRYEVVVRLPLDKKWQRCVLDRQEAKHWVAFTEQEWKAKVNQISKTLKSGWRTRYDDAVQQAYREYAKEYGYLYFCEAFPDGQ